jgi:RNA polymerase sigma-70 factor (ECF subfamily)
VAENSTNQGSFFEVMAQLAAGGDDAARRIFDRFAQALIAQARSEIGSKLRAKVDAEDVVQSAFMSFFRRQADGQFDLAGWDNLWALLLTITIRKCLNRRQYHRRLVRDVGREASVHREGADSLLPEALDREPSPEEAAMLVDEIEHFLGGLSERDRRVAELRLQNYNPAEIADRLSCAERTVFRALNRARERLEQLEAACD